MNILIIGATHGNELLGPRLCERLLKKHSVLLEHITFMIGNPRAYASNKRYIECDLNRSYASKGSQYEVKRANEIVDHIIRTQPDLVLDMHTTSCEQSTCLIIRDLNGVMKKRFLRASHVTTLLKVRPLNDILSEHPNIIGYEVSQSYMSALLLDEIIQDIARFVAGDIFSREKELFVMKGKILKSEVDAEGVKKFKNFQMSHEGYVPVLVGENSYKE